MRYGFLATRELDVCAKFKVCSSKTGAATLRTYIYRTPDIHIPYEQKGETGESRGKPKYVAELRTGRYTVQVSGKVPVSPSAFQ